MGCHTRELVFQISKEYERFAKYIPGVKVGVFFGGLAIARDEQVLKSNCPNIVVGTPGRILALVRSKKLNLKNLKHFILDECDKMLEQLDMRRDVQEIFRATPHEKQVMMFSATLSKEIRPVCKKFMQDPMEVYVDDEAKLTLHGLQQHYVKLKDQEKNRKLFELLDVLEFNQVVIFVKSVQRCMALAQLLIEQNFPAIAIHRSMAQEERLYSTTTCLMIQIPTSIVWHELVDLAPKGWQSRLFQMKLTPRYLTKYKIDLKLTSRNCPKKLICLHTLKAVNKLSHEASQLFLEFEK